MRKSNNKGFSLIEVIIAVAVLTILIVPIVMQLTKALETNANAKERQAAVENADEVLEYFQKTNKEVLDNGGTGEINAAKAATSDFSTIKTEPVSCKLYSTTGADLSKTVTYNATNYIASDVKLGRKKNDYSRTIIVDDLNNRVMAAGYRISTDAEVTDELKNNASGGTWVQTNEGNIVQYDSDGRVKAAVVEEHSEEEKAIGYVDPNKLNLGYVQDLDSDTMAIIPAETLQMDEQFNNDVYNTVLSTIIKRRSEIDPKTNQPYISDAKWEEITQEMDDSSIGYEGTQLDYAIRRVRTNSKRLICINVKHDTTMPGSYFYRVTVDVFYDTVIQPLVVGSDVISDEIKISYNYAVYSKDFNMKEPPNIYMVYEPLQGAMLDEKYYVSDEYIVASGDYDSLINRDKMSKLYLIKSAKTSMSGTKFDKDDAFYSYSFAEGSYVGVYGKTNIHISSMKPKKKLGNATYPGAKDGDQVKSDSPNAKPMEIYTNISTSSESNKKDQFKVAVGVPARIENSAEFSKIKDAYDGWANDGTNWTEAEKNEDNNHVFDYSYVKSLSEGERTLSRLFTVRVSVTNKKTQETIYLTGAKGAD